MLAGATARQNALSNTSVTQSSFLPFLYCTKTILRNVRTKPVRYTRDGNAKLYRPAIEQRVRPHEFTINEPWEEKWSQAGARASKEDQSKSYLPFEGAKDPSDANVGANDLDKPLTEERSGGHKYQAHRYRDDSKARSRNTVGRTPFVPFERPPAGAREDPFADLEGSTITPNEQKAFESLFNLRSSKPRSPATDQDGSQSQGGASLDSILESSLQSIRPEKEESSKQDRSRPQRLPRPKPEMPAALRKLEAAATTATTNEQQQGTQVTQTREGRLFDPARRVAKKDITDVKKLLDQCETDVEVWRVLCERVLGRAVALGLDGTRDKSMEPVSGEAEAGIEVVDAAVPAQRPSSAVISPPPHSTVSGEIPPLATPEPNHTSSNSSKTPKPTPLEILTHALPIHLIGIFQHLQTHYPSSPLPLSILPLLKSLGPATAALGLSTPLYNAHMRMLWATYTDLTAIVSTLEEMDKEVYEFDAGTAVLLKEISVLSTQAKKGELGSGVWTLWRCKGMRRASQEIWKWGMLVERRRREGALRRAREMEVLESGREGYDGSVVEAPGVSELSRQGTF